MPEGATLPQCGCQCWVLFLSEVNVSQKKQSLVDILSTWPLPALSHGAHLSFPRGRPSFVCGVIFQHGSLWSFISWLIHYCCHSETVERGQTLYFFPNTHRLIWTYKLVNNLFLQQIFIEHICAKHLILGMQQWAWQSPGRRPILDKGVNEGPSSSCSFNLAYLFLFVITVQTTIPFPFPQNVFSETECLIFPSEPWEAGLRTLNSTAPWGLQ